jgi:hypothetical protein
MKSGRLFIPLMPLNPWIAWLERRPTPEKYFPVTNLQWK